MKVISVKQGKGNIIAVLGEFENGIFFLKDIDYGKSKVVYLNAWGKITETNYTSLDECCNVKKALRTPLYGGDEIKLKF